MCWFRELWALAEEIENEEQVIKYLEKEELARFLQTAKGQGLERDYAIFTTLAYSGLKVGELCAMKWRDLYKLNLGFRKLW
ncbi:hypothetical protein BK133_22030 [Paenibacillus sp. FSL H8-0548]|uniref:tyrosine-type recombinase/integrase n=1 Tax=Paenibacillus sp. FSL H8-0548 TaxID=1920422 RepID=UPI00096FEA07|nr:tyrosine-type recombinase/integrase [Paenibacillus sp. FSL H8-0548]OMF24957.1 hypothetical protein BK133_22030 [Paenibacillus sp. FSL H8-0548]